MILIIWRFQDTADSLFYPIPNRLLVLVYLQTNSVRAQVETFNYKKALTINRTLSATISTINRSTGEVVFGGADGRGPSTPGLTFTWVWGDGTSINGFFPQTKKYADVTKNYTAKVISNYSAGEKDTVEVLVDFVTAKLTPVVLNPKLKVFIPGQKFTFSNFNSTTLIPFSDNFFAGLARADLEYLLHVGATIEYDFINENVVLYDGKFEQYLLRDSLAKGAAYSLWFTQPVGFAANDIYLQGDTDYSSLYHEMGHNITLNFPANFNFGGKIDGPANAIYSEAMAQVFQYAVGYEVINNYKDYGLDEIMLSKYKNNFFNGVARLRGVFNEYVREGMRFNSFYDRQKNDERRSKDVLQSFLSVPYKFYEYAEQQGKGYRQPIKRMTQFLGRFNAEWQKRYDQFNDTPAGNSFRATMMVAAISHAFQKDLRADFRAINYPISDTDWAFLNPQLLSVSATALTFIATPAGPASVTVTATDTWLASSSQPWLTADVSTGSGNRIVSLSAVPNPALTPRTATFTVSATGLIDQIVTVTQAGLAPALTTSTQSLSFAAAPAGAALISITSNTSWSVVSSQSWLVPEVSVGSGSQALSVSATTNASAVPRMATLTVSATGVPNQFVSITQAGAAPLLAVSASTLTVGVSEGSAATVDVTANTSWTATSSQTWLTVSPGSGSENVKLTVTATLNPLFDPRKATVTVRANGVSDRLVEVVQAAALITDVSTVQSKEVLVYPNPVTDVLQFRGLPTNTVIRIYTADGRLCREVTPDCSGAQISLGDLPIGLYLIRTITGDRSTLSKIVKIQ